MSTRSNILRLAVAALLSTAPRARYSACSATCCSAFLIAVALLVLGVVAHSETPRYWPSYETGRTVIVPPRRETTCPLDGPGAWDCNASRTQPERKPRRER